MEGIKIRKRTFEGATPKNLEEDSKGISILEKVNIGGTSQCICIRGKDTDNPVLLFLHGGPGDPMLPTMTRLNKSLEDDFIVVIWEQRGTGKSYYPFKESDGIDIDTFIGDTYELTKLLLERFAKEKIYIMGNSWGSFLAIQVVQKYPELYYAYIGTGQVVHMIENEKLSYEYTLEQSILRKDKRAERRLREMGRDYYNRPDWYECLQLQRKYLVRYGGAVYGKSNYFSLEKYFVFSAEYSLVDIINRSRGSKQSLKKLWLELLEVDLFETAIEFEIPIYFIQGRHDYNTPSSIVSRYYDTIKAPAKTLIWFENSAHSPQWEEPEKFHRVLKDRILYETYNKKTKGEKNEKNN